jgi:serine/threonine protein kinase
MAPEVNTGQYDQRVDVYSFVIILYDILVGDGRFSNDDDDKKPELCRKMRDGRRPKIPRHVSSLGRELIETCWSMDVSKRPEFRDVLEKLKSAEFAIIERVDKSVVKKWCADIEAQEALLVNK